MLSLMNCVVIHVSPYERVQLENAPHGFIGVAHLAAGGLVTGFFTPTLQRIFNSVGRIEIKTWSGGKRLAEHDAGFIRGHQFACDGTEVEVRHGSRAKPSILTPDESWIGPADIHSAEFPLYV